MNKLSHIVCILSLIGFLYFVTKGVLLMDALYMFYAVIFLIFTVLYRIQILTDSYLKMETLKLKLEFVKAREYKRLRHTVRKLVLKSSDVKVKRRGKK